MEKRLDDWKKSIKRSFSRNIGGDVALELQKLDEAEQTQPQQDQKVHDTENPRASPKKNGHWKSLKRSLSRTVGLRVRHELEKEEQRDGQNAEGVQAGPSPTSEMPMHEAVDAGLTYGEGAALKRMEAAEDVLAATPTTKIPARYRVRRTRLAGIRARNRLLLRMNGPAQVNSGAGSSTAQAASSVSLHALDLGTTPTTPGYPHPLEVEAPVPNGRGKFATWPARSKPFWCCSQQSGGYSLDSSLPGPSRPKARSPAPAAYEHDHDATEYIQPTAPREVQPDDGYTCPTSADPGLLKPALRKAVEGLSAELRKDEEGEIEIGYAGSAEDLQGVQELAECVEEAEAVGQAVQIEAKAGIPEDGATKVFQPSPSGSEETLLGAIQYQVVAGSPPNVEWDASAEDLRAEDLNKEVNMQRIQASIASLQQAVPSNVEEGELEAIVEEEEWVSLEDPDTEAALMRKALLYVNLGERRAVELQEQRAVSSTLLASAELSEGLHEQTSSSGTKGPEPAQWLSSKYKRFLGDSPAEPSTASMPAYPYRDRAESEARTERVRNWFTERDREEKAVETANDLWDASFLDERNRSLNTSISQPRSGLGESAFPDSVESSAVVASSDDYVDIHDARCPVSVPRAPRLRIRTRKQIIRDSGVNHRNSVVIDGWAYLARQQDHGNAGAGVGFATIEECVENFQAEPTE